LSLTRAAIKGSAWTAVIQYGVFIFTFIGNLFLVRLLVPDDYGVFALALSILEFVFILGGLGINHACIFYSDEPDVLNTAQFLAWTLAFFLSVLGLIVGFVLQKLGLYSETVINFILILTPVQALLVPTSVFIASLDKDLNFRRSAVVSSVGPIVGISMALLIAMYDGGVYSLLYKQVFTVVIGFFMASYFSHYKFSLSFNKITAKKIWKYSVKMFFQRMTETLAGRIPNILIGTVGGSNVLGLIERSKYIAQLQNSMLTPFFGKVAFATYSRVKDDKDKISFGLHLNLYWGVRISIFFGVIAFLFPELIIETILGESWLGAAEYLKGFSIYIVFISLFSPMNFALMALGNIFPLVISNVIQIVFVMLGIALAWYTDSSWDVIPWVISVGMLIGTIMLGVVLRRTGLKLQWYKIIKFPLILIISSLFVNSLCVELTLTDWQIVCAILMTYVSIIFILEKENILMLYQIVKN
jgi:teichuronic acid exporter